ncbi:MAG: 4Fe-4S dicluster domain-containing protein [Bacteroidetes bacterium]|nr:4Fe-4S dicluster domain-containing protein [Bacteroidota bacterium]
MPHAILVDLTECVGCGACRDACQQVHHFPQEECTSLDAHNFTTLRKIETADGQEVFARQMCQHCQDPACASACLVGALEKTRDGAVTWDTDKCIGCRYCMVACPFDIPKYEWDTNNPKVRKCTMCYTERHLDADSKTDKEGYVLDRSGKRVSIDGRLVTAEDRDMIVEMTTNSDGKRATACSVACPIGATLYGERSELLAEAHRRIRSNPDSYVQKVYGQTEVGGTSVFYLSSMPFEQLGFSTKLDTEALPLRTWRVLEKLPDVILTAGVALGAVYWITNRREDVRKFEEEVKNQRSQKKS